MIKQSVYLPSLTSPSSDRRIFAPCEIDENFLYHFDKIFKKSDHTLNYVGIHIYIYIYNIIKKRLRKFDVLPHSIDIRLLCFKSIKAVIGPTDENRHRYDMT